MFRNYFKTAVRNFKRNKSYALINTLGLAIGIAACFLIFLVSAPVAYYIMHQWLQNYAYKIPLGASIFILAIISSIFIAWITVAHRAIKAALANRVKSLRKE